MTLRLVLVALLATLLVDCEQMPFHDDPDSGRMSHHQPTRFAG